MIKRLQISFDILMLCLLLGIEGSRFKNFFGILSGSELASIFFAVAVSLIIVYLALGEYETTSKISVVVCIGLSVISYIDPFVKEVLEVDFSIFSDLEKTKQEIPKWQSKWESKLDKEMKSLGFKEEVEKVKSHNEKVEKEILILNTVGKTKMIAFLFSAFLMSFCVPLLTYLISHKLASEFKGVIAIKRKNEDIENIFNRIGGKKI